MSKVSVRPDNTQSKGLRPTAFPMTDISQFSISQSSIYANSPNRTFPDQSEIKFQSSEVSKLPNLFHYNDRTKLSFSSDEEDNSSPIAVQKPILMSENIRQKKEAQKMQVKEKTQRQAKVEAMREQFRKQREKQQIARRKQEQIDKEKSLKKLKISQGQINIKILEEQNKSNYMNNTKKSKQQSKNKNRSKIIKMDINLDVEQNNESFVQQLSITETPTHNKRTEQLTPRHHEPSDKKQIQSSSLEVVQIPRLQHLESLIDNKRQSISASASKMEQKEKEQQTPVTPTRRKKRHKIFDQSSKRSYMNTDRERTPTRGVQTQQRFSKDTQTLSNRRPQSNTPQVKALNILEKLVDQIDHHSSSFKGNKWQEHVDDSIYRDLSEFNKQCLEELNDVESIGNINIMHNEEFLNKLRSFFEESLKWRQKVSNQILNLSFSNTMEYQIVKKFEKNSETIELYNKLSSDYVETVHRLRVVENKLEQYVIIMQKQDSKGLYKLMTWLNAQLERMKHLKASCGKSRLERMFSEYLRKQISQLEEIKQQIDGNFMRNFPQLLY